MPDIESFELKRMLQRRGVKADLYDLPNGELGIVEDEKKVYFGLQGVNYGLIGEPDIVDNLTSNSDKKVLSAKQGAVLNSRLGIIQNTVNQINSNIADTLTTKQDVILYKGIDAPLNKEFIWFDTN